MINKKEFDKKIKESLNYSDSLFRYDINYPMYFNSDYISKMELYLDKNGLTNKLKLEMQPPAKAKSKEIKKMCSVASSSRLCLFYTRQLMKEDNVSIEIEKQCDNGLESGEVPHLDAWCKETNTYYECKCHEICDKDHDKLIIKYKEKLHLFNIDDSKLNIIEEVKNGKKEYYYDIRLSHLGIENDERPINKLHFDVKQFICHLIGIQYSDKKDLILNYIFFTPKNIFDSSIKELYETLEKEWNMIMNSPAIMYFKKNNKNISIRYDLIPVTKFKDLVIEKEV